MIWKKKRENAQRIPAIVNIGSLTYVKSSGILYKYEQPWSCIHVKMLLHFLVS
jgi:hypothetical protein